MKKFILALLLLVPAFGAYADNSPKDVQALIAKGDYTGAEAMLRDAVSAHPQSAKAHYVLAEVLAHEGNVGEAKAEATKASQLDPETKFTDPARFRHFQQELDQALSPAPKAHTAATTTPYNNPQPAVSNGGGSSSMLVGILVFGAVIVLIIVLWSRRRRSANEYMNNPPPMGNASAYSNYPGGNYPGGMPGYAPPPSSGAGAAVAAGLGGVAAGMLLDEALNSRGEREAGAAGVAGAGAAAAAPAAETPDPRGQAYDELRDDPIDMGNNDSSWDDSSSSDNSDDDQW